ncbi:hypothetical protein [Pseudonocardia sp.]|jgi:hypothetical protein|uniref:hypothetical protein n=1 Tax=Pseudonocardia sp. TaxID=60912 RepID=UPI002F42702B
MALEQFRMLIGGKAVEAVKLANDTPHGLPGAVWTKDVQPGSWARDEGGSRWLSSPNCPSSR